MTDMPEIRSAVDAAEQAAAAGDYAAAEQHLREAVRLQETDLGAHHPDLANTLNNLGVVYDRRDKHDEAESCYRRAYALASAALAPDHPFVATSRSNLEDFCGARGKPFDGETREHPTPTRDPESPEHSTPTHDPSTVPSSGLFRPMVTSSLIAVGLLLAVFIARPWFRSNDRLASAVAPAQDASTAVTTSSKELLETSNPLAGPQKTQREEQARKTSLPSALTVAEARVCRDLSTGQSHGTPGGWRCERLNAPASSGSIYFYTRLKSPRDMTVQHRWYQGHELRKMVALRIRANPTDGYRTFSRTAVDSRRAGDWKVELTTTDGVLLHEEHFIVR
jgi:hypothetical protein